MSNIKDFIGRPDTGKVFERGICESGVVKQLNADFPSEPEIFLSPYQMPCYNKNSSTQDQTLTINHTNINEYDTNKWEFMPDCNLVLGDSVGNESVSGITSSAGQSIYGVGPHDSPNFSYHTTGYSSEVNISTSDVKEITANFSLSGYAQCLYNQSEGGPYYWNSMSSVNFLMCVTVQAYDGSAWVGGSTSSWVSGGSGSRSSTVSTTSDITKIRTLIQVTRTSNIWKPTGSTFAHEHVGTSSMTSYTYQLDGYSVLQAGSLSYMAIDIL